MKRTCRVVIVDDDAWMRRGRAAWLAEAPEVEVLATLTHEEALAYDHWESCDVALVDAWDEQERFDRFPGVGVVEHIRARRRPEETTVVVLSGHVFDDVLRLRMAEAGADYFCGTNEICDLDDLVELISRPSERHRSAPGDPGRLAELGLTESSRPNAALRDITERGLEGVFEAEGRPGEPGLSRRKTITLRRRLAALAGLAPPPPRRPSQTVPEWRAVVRVVNRARGAEPKER